MRYPYTERQVRFITIANQLAAQFAPRAAEQDRSAAFPHQNFAEIRAAHLPALIIPEEYGGWGATLLETLMTTQALAVGDGSTALSAVMHFQTMGHAAETRSWPPELFERICRDSVERGALINSIATEPELGSPSRGGKPKTTATPLYASGASDKSDRSDRSDTTPIAWEITGHKTWASMCPTLDYMIIPALLLDGSEEVARFVVAKGSGEEIVETWDALGMRSTGSHDMFFNQVRVESRNMLNRGEDAKSTQVGLVNAWFSLGTSAVYLGVAQAAIQTAIQYAHERKPTALGKPIAEVEIIQRHIGQAQFLLQQSQMLLYHAADLWHRHPDQRFDLGPLVSIAKVTVTNNAILILEECMRVVGGASMTKTLPLERYYRDVRGGLYHPPNEDALQLSLGKTALFNK